MTLDGWLKVHIILRHKKDLDFNQPTATNSSSVEL